MTQFGVVPCTQTMPHDFRDVSRLIQVSLRLSKTLFATPVLADSSIGTEVAHIVTVLNTGSRIGKCFTTRQNLGKSFIPASRYARTNMYNHFFHHVIG